MSCCRILLQSTPSSCSSIQDTWIIPHTQHTLHYTSPASDHAGGKTVGPCSHVKVHPFLISVFWMHMLSLSCFLKFDPITAQSCSGTQVPSFFLMSCEPTVKELGSATHKNWRGLHNCDSSQHQKHSSSLLYGDKKAMFSCSWSVSNPSTNASPEIALDIHKSTQRSIIFIYTSPVWLVWGQPSMESIAWKIKSRLSSS